MRLVFSGEGDKKLVVTLDFLLVEPYSLLKKHMEFYDYNRICDDAVINTITARVIEALEKKMEQLKEQEDTPFVFGIDGLARYLGVGETIAQELKKNKEINYSQRGRKIWFKKSDIEKFMQRNKA